MSDYGPGEEGDEAEFVDDTIDDTIDDATDDEVSPEEQLLLDRKELHELDNPEGFGDED